MPEHAQVTVPDPDGHGTIRVDAGIAPLLAALWARGFRTTSSCEGSPGGSAYVALWPYDAAPEARAALPAALRMTARDVGEMIVFPAAEVSDWARSLAL